MTSGHRRLGAGQDQRARPDGRGRPARRRGRRRLRRRGRAAGRRRRRGARRPRRRVRRPRRPTADELRARAAGDARAARQRARRSCPSWPTSPTACARRSPRSASSAGAVHAAAHPRRPAPRPGAAHRAPLGAHRLRGRADGRLAERRRASTPRCATSPACCARSTTPATTASSRPGTTRSWSTGPPSGPRATATRSAPATPRPAGTDPREHGVLLRALRGRQGRVRGRLRGPQPAGLAADPAGLADPTRDRWRNTDD